MSLSYCSLTLDYIQLPTHNTTSSQHANAQLTELIMYAKNMLTHVTMFCQRQLNDSTANVVSAMLDSIFMYTKCQFGMGTINSI